MEEPPGSCLFNNAVAYSACNSVIISIKKSLCKREIEISIGYTLLGVGDY